MVPKETTYLLADLNYGTTKICIPDVQQFKKLNKQYKRELTKEDLEYYTAHPTWIKVRLFLFWCFWMAFLIVMIISIFIYMFPATLR